MLYSASKASTIAGDKRPLYFRFVPLHTINESAANTMNLPTSLWRGGNKWNQYFVNLYHDFPRYDWLRLGENNLN
jgi:hypothetical protein